MRKNENEDKKKKMENFKKLRLFFHNGIIMIISIEFWWLFCGKAFFLWNQNLTFPLWLSRKNYLPKIKFLEIRYV